MPDWKPRIELPLTDQEYLARKVLRDKRNLILGVSVEISIKCVSGDVEQSGKYGYVHIYLYHIYYDLGKVTKMSMKRARNYQQC